jgi:hypothetical protein
MGIWDSTKKFLFGGGATEGLETTAPNTEYAQGYLRRQLDGMGGRTAPMAQATQLGQAAQLAGGPQDQVRADQRAAAGYLQGVMQGNRAGAGELAVNRQVSGANAAQQAAARMARGSGAALAGRNAMRGMADIGLMGAGQAAQAQMQDQANAVGQLGGILAQTRGADLDFAGQNAQLQQQRMLQQGAFGQQAMLANQDAQLRMMGMNDAASAGYLQQLTGLDQAAWMRELQKRQLAMGDKGALPGLLQAGGTALGAYYGGPAGAQAGGKMGAAAGGGGTPAAITPSNSWGWTPEHG